MNGWLTKKFQSQFKSHEVSKQALGKLKQLESRNDTHNADTQTLEETSYLCRNCSMVSSGLNNTVSITLKKDLLASTQLGDLTSVEELTSDPGFQEFLSSQLELYFKFIANASTNNLLSKAKKRALDNEHESLNSTVLAHKSRTCHGQASASSRTFQLAAGCQDNLNNDLDLSLIEEEDSVRATEGRARNGCEAQTIERERSTSRDKAMNQSPTKSRFSKQTWISKERQKADASAIPGSSTMETGPAKVRARSLRQTQRCEEKENADTSVMRRSSRQAQQSQEKEQVAATGIRQLRATRKLSPQKPVPADEAKMDLSTRKTSHSTKPSNVNVTDNQLTTQPTSRKRGETSVVNGIEPQQSDNVFRVPLPPKPKTLRSRSNDKHSDNETKAKEGQISDVSSRQNDENVFKVPLPVKPKSTRPQSIDTDTTVSSRRTGRVSKPPGSFWDPTADKRQPESRSFADLKIDKKPTKNGSEMLPSGRRIETGVAKTSKTAVKRRADIPLSEMDSESGYSSVGAAGPAGKFSRVGVKEPGKRQDASKAQNAVGRKQRHPKNVEPAEELEGTRPAEEDPPRRLARSTKVKPAEIERPFSMQHDKEPQVEPQKRRGRQVKDGEHPSSKDMMQGRKNAVFKSDSDETKNEERPKRVAKSANVKPTEIEQPSSKQHHKEAQAELPKRGGRQFKDVENPSSKGDRKNIFSGSDSDETDNDEEPPRRVVKSITVKPSEEEEHSDSEETNDEYFVISNKNTYYDPSRRRETTAENRNFAKRAVSLVDSSSDEEEFVGRRRGGPPPKADPPQTKKKIGAGTLAGRNNVKGAISIVESSSDEEEVVGRRKRGPPEKAGPPQTKKKSDSDTRSDHPAKVQNVESKAEAQAHTTSSPLATRSLRKQQVKARYIFAGSSTSDDDSVCASNNNKNDLDHDSSSFVDDASFVSFVRGDGEPTAIRPAAGRNRNADINRRPQLLSRFRR